MTSDGILGFCDDLHSIASRMDHEVTAESGASTASPLGEQGFLGPWLDYLARHPWSDVAGDVAGLFALVDEIRGPLHVVNPTDDFGRLNRFNLRLQQLWDSGAKRGHTWTEPRPPDRAPGKSSSSPVTQLENIAEIALVVGILWLLSRH